MRRTISGDLGNYSTIGQSDYKSHKNPKQAQQNKGANEHQSRETTSEAPKDQNEMLLQIMERLDRLEERQRSVPSSQKKFQESKFKDVECFNCHKKGHLARTCPDKRNYDSQNLPNQRIVRMPVDQIDKQPLNLWGSALAAKERSNLSM